MEENKENKDVAENETKNDQSKKETPKGLKMDFETLVGISEKFQRLKKECVVAVRLSLTGITNLVVNYEDQALVEAFLDSCYGTVNQKTGELQYKELYNDTYNIDAVELQKGSPGAGNALAYLDEFIYGTFERDKTQKPDGLTGEFPVKIDPKTGKRLRNKDGFVLRKSRVIHDPILVIRNLDYCIDFCKEEPALIDPRAVYIFDNFRHPHIKRGCVMLLISNKKLKLPFKTRTIRFESVDEVEANHIIDSAIDLFGKYKIQVSFTESQKEQIIRKLSGLTYTEASDIFCEVMSNSKDKNKSKEGVQEIDSQVVIRKLRQKVNSSFMEDSFGLSHLTPRPWEDYICPESSNFTTDVKKIVRDFQEIKELKDVKDNLISTKQDEGVVEKNITAIRSRMPHVIVLYGKGGVGKSAFPVHFAGLLDFDAWDFNINACHSKWIGEGSERMREALIKITQASHVIVRVDEYDRAMGSTSASGHGMHEAHKQVESEFMNWLQNNQEEGIFAKRDIFVILTTNHKENITGPLLRSGRADLVIDISDFDEKSMIEAFKSAPRRMTNRGVSVLGFKDLNEFQGVLSELDIEKLAPIASKKGFTVRDVDILLQEMAAHRYYFRKGKSKINWTTEYFIKVLEHSEGSTKAEDTGELILGDRYLMEDKKEEPQMQLPLDNDNCKDEESLEAFRNVPFFKLPSEEILDK